MSTAESTQSDNRQQIAQGLRELADFIEQNPDAPAPKHMTVRRYYYGYGDNSAEQFKADVRALGAEVELDGTDVEARRTFSGGVQFLITIPASQICVEREVTTTAFVLPSDLDQKAIPLDRATAQDDPRGDNDR